MEALLISRPPRTYPITIQGAVVEKTSSVGWTVSWEESACRTKWLTIPS